ncbi:hypothetical protein ACG33_04260 [Steroidobacter denitrificans]|uniref:RDD domain-containing protein n=1 Tax=Steroidobacter denitrificans TaxID=465721 RepID=A0A127F7B5_STEDE|nr:RDD family protein [Steroidobacter denitrificans]AMN46333.1 hypothetical protein ACG33_04260 [Steroidobacter denitrificans]
MNPPSPRASAAPSRARDSAGVTRRFGAMLYDSLVVIALLMVVTALLMIPLDGEPISAERVGIFEYVYQGLLVSMTAGFFGLFWTRRGQTLGMMAWRLKLQRMDGRPIGWRDALLRLAGATISLGLLGLGYFWIWIDRDRLAWHDRWSRTRVCVLPKR